MKAIFNAPVKLQVVVDAEGERCGKCRHRAAGKCSLFHIDPEDGRRSYSCIKAEYDANQRLAEEVYKLKKRLLKLLADNAVERAASGLEPKDEPNVTLYLPSAIKELRSLCIELVAESRLLRSKLKERAVPVKCPDDRTDNRPKSDDSMR